MLRLCRDDDDDDGGGGGGGCLCYVADLFAVYLTDSLFGGCVYIAFHANANVCLFINWPLKTGGNV